MNTKYGTELILLQSTYYTKSKVIYNQTIRLIIGEFSNVIYYKVNIHKIEIVIFLTTNK